VSRAVWARTLLSPAGTPVADSVYDVYDPPLVVPRTRSFPAPTPALVELPDRRAYRSLSRAGVMLCAVGLPAAAALAGRLAADPYAVGIYCAIESGPQNYEGARELAAAPRAEFAARFKRANHPKRYLTQLANLPAAHLGIFLDVRGPVNVFCHSTAGALHALEQAEIDLAEGRLAAALVCAAWSLEDPLLALRARLDWPLAVLAEGAAAIVLEDGGGDARPPGPAEPEGPARGGADRCGLAQPLIDIARIVAHPSTDDGGLAC
jgi:hypothetical protein